MATEIPPVTTSRESQSIIDYVDSCGIPYRVTDVNTPGVHSANSWHYAKGTGGVGTAVDFGGATRGVNPESTPQMLAIYRALLDVASQLAELIHAGAGITRAVKGGRLVAGAAFYGPVTWANHRNHVHVAVPRGTFLTPRSRPTAGVAGSGPPTVTVARYPEQGTMVLERHDVDIPALDGQGRGWVELNVPSERVVSIVATGPYPPVDNYWTVPTVARQDRGGRTIVSLVEGPPNGHVTLSVWVLA